MIHELASIYVWSELYQRCLLNENLFLKKITIRFALFSMVFDKVIVPDSVGCQSGIFVRSTVKLVAAVAGTLWHLILCDELRTLLCHDSLQGLDYLMSPKSASTLKNKRWLSPSPGLTCIIYTGLRLVYFPTPADEILGNNLTNTRRQGLWVSWGRREGTKGVLELPTSGQMASRLSWSGRKADVAESRVTLRIALNYEFRSGLRLYLVMQTLLHQFFLTCDTDAKLIQ